MKKWKFDVINWNKIFCSVAVISFCSIYKTPIPYLLKKAFVTCVNEIKKIKNSLVWEKIVKNTVDHLFRTILVIGDASLVSWCTCLMWIQYEKNRCLLHINHKKFPCKLCTLNGMVTLQ